jgi:thiol:disulfide interchange protein DsbA
VPVWFQEVPFASQQRLFYTLETLGLAPTLHRKVFAAIHNDRARLRTPEDMRRSR